MTMPWRRNPPDVSLALGIAVLLMMTVPVLVVLAIVAGWFR